jgi:hypothetical protein
VEQLAGGRLLLAACMQGGWSLLAVEYGHSHVLHSCVDHGPEGLVYGATGHFLTGLFKFLNVYYIFKYEKNIKVYLFTKFLI